jgi:hypothetical protein
MEFLAAMPCSLVGGCQHFGETCNLHVQGKMSTLRMKATLSSETVVMTSKTTWYHSPENNNFVA